MCSDTGLRIVSDKLILRYMDRFGKPRDSLLAYIQDDTVYWLKPNIGLKMKIGSLERRGEKLVVVLEVN